MTRAEVDKAVREIHQQHSDLTEDLRSEVVLWVLENGQGLPEGLSVGFIVGMAVAVLDRRKRDSTDMMDRGKVT
jgi:hypothetical protein